MAGPHPVWRSRTGKVLIKAQGRRSDATLMSTQRANPVHSPPAAGAPPAPFGATWPPLPPTLPPPLPRAVIPIYDPYSPGPALPRWPAAGVVAFVAALSYLIGMLRLTSSLARPGGAPTSGDLLLSCGVFPLALVGGMFLAFASVIAVVVSPGWSRVLAVAAVLLNGAAFVVAFPGK